MAKIKTSTNNRVIDFFNLPIQQQVDSFCKFANNQKAITKVELCYIVSNYSRPLCEAYLDRNRSAVVELVTKLVKQDAMSFLPLFVENEYIANKCLGAVQKLS